MFKAVIFDMNGVIVNDERIHQESWRQLCNKYGLHLTEDEFKNQIFGRTEKDTLKYIFDRELTEKELADYSDERVKIAISIFQPQMALADGLLALLYELDNSQLPTAIATSSRQQYTDFILDNLKIRHFFQEIVTAEDITHGKPSPEIYFLAAKRLDIDPKFCVVFEDTLSGIKSVQSAGMKVVAITTTHTKSELISADNVVNSFTEVSVQFLQNL